MPLYEYRCLNCQKRSTILVLSLTNPLSPSCNHCKSTRLERLMSRFSSPKSEEARIESLANPEALAGLDENDPASMTRFMKKMEDEMGEDFSDEIAETMDSPGGSSSDVDASDVI